MSRAHYELYARCFPAYPLTYEQFCSMTGIENSAVVLDEKAEDELVGFAVVGCNNISVIAVSKEHRNRGVGARLLKRAEEILKEKGEKEIFLGRGSNSIFQGVPMDNDGQDVSDFFAKRGYTKSHITYNMDIDTANFEYSALTIPKPENVTYRFATEADKDALLAAVEQVVPEWVGLYKGYCGEVLLALCDGEIAAFEMIEERGGFFCANAKKHGSIGCVGTVPKFRRRGIGLDMTAQSVRILKARGCDRVQLLYLVFDKWYGKLGFEITSTQWMGSMKLE